MSNTRISSAARWIRAKGRRLTAVLGRHTIARQHAPPVPEDEAPHPTEANSPNPQVH